MTVPAYAAHLSEEKYKKWSAYWRYGAGREISSPEDAAAFLMIVAVEADEAQSQCLTYDDGHSFEPVPALMGSKADLAVKGMEIALTGLFNLEAHGVNALNNLAQTAAFKTRAGWTEKTVVKFMELIRRLPWDEVDQSNDRAMAFQPPAHQAVRHVLDIAQEYVEDPSSQERRALIRPGAEPVRETLISYIADYLKNAHFDRTRWCAGENIPSIFESIASDAEIEKFRPQFIDTFGWKIEEFTEEDRETGKRDYPRLLGPCL